MPNVPAPAKETAPASVSKEASVKKPTTPVATDLGAAKKKPNKMILFGGLVVLIAISIVSYFVFNVVTTPARVKDQTAITQKVISDYNDTLDEIMTELIEDEVSSANDLERSLKDAKDLLQEAEEQHDRLEELTDEITVAQLKEYKSFLQDYLSSGQEVIDVQKDNIKMGEAYLKPFRDMEELQIDKAGMSTLMISDPTEYVDEVEDYLEQQRLITKTFEEADVTGLFVDYHQTFVETLKLMTDYVETMKEAVEARSTQKMVEADREFAKPLKNLSEKEEKVKDVFDKKIEDLRDAVEDKFDLVDEEYGKVKEKYKL